MRLNEVYHVLNRAVARWTIFEKPDDYVAFMRVVDETWGIVPLTILCDGGNAERLSDFFRRLTVMHTKAERDSFCFFGSRTAVAVLSSNVIRCRMPAREVAACLYLVGRTPRSAFVMSEDSEDLLVLISVPTEIEAAAIVAALAQDDIRAVATGGLTSGFKAEAPGEVQVLVKQADAERAQQTLLEIRSGENPIDWSQVDVGEPED